MHKFEFKSDDLFINRLKTYPEYNIYIYQGQMYNNRQANRAGNGGLVVYDINRPSGSNTDLEHVTNRAVTPFVVSGSDKTVFKAQLYQPLVKNFSSDAFFTRQYEARVEDRRKLSSYGSPFDTIDNESVYQSSYASEVQIQRRLTSAVNSTEIRYYNTLSANIEFAQIPTTSGDSPSPINLTASALHNSARKYRVLSPHFIFSGSTPHERDYVTNFLGGRDLIRGSNDINFIFIPNMYYGSTIKKGSVELNFYITGSKMATCADINHNGELIGTTGSTTGHVVGLVMYDEGIIMLTSSANLENVSPNIRYNGTSSTASSWLYYGTGLNDNFATDVVANRLSSASYDLNFKGTSYVNTMTMFAHARKGHLNHSNNPTYKDLTFTPTHTTGSGKMFAEGEMPLTNIVSASYVSASFEKTTYISKVHIYDESGNLIAITSMAKPVKKTLNDEFTFKMKLDL